MSGAWSGLRIGRLRYYRRPGRPCASRSGDIHQFGRDPVTHASRRGGSFGAAELLDPTAEPDLRRIEIALRVDRDVVDPFELARLAAVAAPLRQHLPVS